MSDWATVAGTLGGTALGIAGTWRVAIWQAGQRRAEREADLREKRRSEAATLVGPAISALRDLDPNANVGVLRGNPRALEALREKWEAWLSAQAKLEVIGAMHPDSDVSQLSEAVITGGTNLLTRLHWAITEGGPQPEEWWNEVNGLRDQALADARSLVQAVLEQPA